MNHLKIYKIEAICMEIKNKLYYQEKTVKT